MPGGGANSACARHRYAYIDAVLGCLRFIGILNAAIWLGAGIFFTVAVGPAIFSPEMKELMGPTAFPFYSGGVALIIFKRFFLLQYICGTIGLLHLCAEAFYLGKRPPTGATTLVAVMLSVGLLGGLVLQPRMTEWRHTMYTGATSEQKEQAHHTFGMWHGISQGVNLLVLAGLLFHLVRLSRPPEIGRFSNFGKLRS